MNRSRKSDHLAVGSTPLLVCLSDCLSDRAKTVRETENRGNATLSITLHLVSKLRLPLSIRAYSPRYTGVYTWK